MKTYLIRAIQHSLFFSGGLLILGVGCYMALEPFLVLGATSQTVTVTLNVTSGVAVTVDSNAVNMSTNLGVSQNTAVGTSTFTVTTNDSNGYTFNVAASTNPAMQSGGNKIADFPTTTPQLWTSGIGATDARFGFSVIGNDVTPGGGYWGSGSFCNGNGTSTISSTLKYTGFYTSATTTSKNSGTTTPAGDTTTLCYAVNQNNTYIPSGTYTASITGTAVAN